MRWIAYSGNTLHQVRNMPGCYVVLNGGDPVYIGQADRVRSRLVKGHKMKPLDKEIVSSPWGPLHEFSLKVRYDRRFGESLMREARLIRKLRPARNVRHQAYKRRRPPRLTPGGYKLMWREHGLVLEDRDDRTD